MSNLLRVKKVECSVRAPAVFRHRARADEGEIRVIRASCGAMGDRDRELGSDINTCLQVCSNTGLSKGERHSCRKKRT